MVEQPRFDPLDDKMREAVEWNRQHTSDIYADGLELCYAIEAIAECSPEQTHAVTLASALKDKAGGLHQELEQTKANLDQLKAAAIEILSWIVEADLLADAEIADEMEVIDEVVDPETDDEATWPSTKLKAEIARLKKILGGSPFNESSDFSQPPRTLSSASSSPTPGEES